MQKNDWENMRLGDIATILSGGDAPKGHMSEIKTEEYSVPIYSNGISEKGLYGYTDKASVFEPATTISARGTIGVVFRRTEPYLPIVRLISVIGKREIIDSDFLYYKLCNTKIWGDGSVQAQLTIPMISDYIIRIPNLEIQKRIASVLASLDDKIELNAQINHNLEEQAKAIFKSWAANCQKHVTIGDIATNILDYTPNQNSQVVLINSSDVTQGHFEHHLLSENKELKGHFKKRFNKFDILFSEIRPRNRHYAYVLFNTEKYIASTRLMVLRNKPEKISSSLLYQILTSDEVCESFTVSTETRSGTFPQGCFEDLSKISTPIESLDKQEKITSILDGIYKKIFFLDEEKRKLTQLRDSLLPKLMSGEIDVSEVTI